MASENVVGISAELRQTISEELQGKVIPAFSQLTEQQALLVQMALRVGASFDLIRNAAQITSAQLRDFLAEFNTVAISKVEIEKARHMMEVDLEKRAQSEINAIHAEAIRYNDIRNKAIEAQDRQHYEMEVAQARQAAEEIKAANERQFRMDTGYMPNPYTMGGGSGNNIWEVIRDARAMRFALMEGVVALSMLQIALGEQLPQGAREASRGLLIVADSIMAGAMVGNWTGAIIGGITNLILVLGIAAMTADPQIAAFNKSIESLGKKDDIIEGLVKLTGIAEKEAETVMEAARKNREYAASINDMRKAFEDSQNPIARATERIQSFADAIPPPSKNAFIDGLRIGLVSLGIVLQQIMPGLIATAVALYALTAPDEEKIAKFEKNLRDLALRAKDVADTTKELADVTLQARDKWAMEGRDLAFMPQYEAASKEQERIAKEIAEPLRKALEKSMDELQKFKDSSDKIASQFSDAWTKAAYDRALADFNASQESIRINRSLTDTLTKNLQAYNDSIDRSNRTLTDSLLKQAQDLADRKFVIDREYIEKLADIQYDQSKTANSTQEQAIKDQRNFTDDSLKIYQRLADDLFDLDFNTNENRQKAKTWSEVLEIDRRAEHEREMMTRRKDEGLSELGSRIAQAQQEFDTKKRLMEEDYTHRREIATRELSDSIADADTQNNRQLETIRLRSKNELDDLALRLKREDDLAKLHNKEQLDDLRIRVQNEMAAIDRRYDQEISRIQQSDRESTKAHKNRMAEIDAEIAKFKSMAADVGIFAIGMASVGKIIDTIMPANIERHLENALSAIRQAIHPFDLGSVISNQTSLITNITSQQQAMIDAAIQNNARFIPAAIDRHYDQSTSADIGILGVGMASVGPLIEKLGTVAASLGTPFERTGGASVSTSAGGMNTIGAVAPASIGDLISMEQLLGKAETNAIMSALQQSGSNTVSLNASQLRDLSGIASASVSPPIIQPVPTNVNQQIPSGFGSPFTPPIQSPGIGTPTPMDMRQQVEDILNTIGQAFHSFDLGSTMTSISKTMGDAIANLGTATNRMEQAQSRLIGTISSASTEQSVSPTVPLPTNTEGLSQQVQNILDAINLSLRLPNLVPATPSQPSLTTNITDQQQAFIDAVIRNNAQFISGEIVPLAATTPSNIVQQIPPTNIPVGGSNPFSINVGGLEQQIQDAIGAIESALNPFNPRELSASHPQPMAISPYLQPPLQEPSRKTEVGMGSPFSPSTTESTIVKATPDQWLNYLGITSVTPEQLASRLGSSAQTSAYEVRKLAALISGDVTTLNSLIHDTNYIHNITEKMATGAASISPPIVPLATGAASISPPIVPPTITVPIGTQGVSITIEGNIYGDVALQQKIQDALNAVDMALHPFG